MNQIMEYFTSDLIIGLVSVSVFAAFVSFGVISILDAIFKGDE